MNKLDGIVEKIILSLKFLDKFSFVDIGNLRIEGGKNLHQWVRYTDWKLEKIQLCYPSRDQDWCLITFWIYLLIDGDEYLLTSVDIGQMKNSKQYYLLPKIFKSIRSKSLIEKITNDVSSSLDWFEKKDKKECLNLIHSGNDDVIINPSKRIYSKAIELLGGDKGVSP